MPIMDVKMELKSWEILHLLEQYLVILTKLLCSEFSIESSDLLETYRESIS